MAVNQADNAKTYEKGDFPYPNHEPIIFNGDSSMVAGENGIVSGSGIKSDPYIIEHWTFDATNGTAIEMNYILTTYFIIRNCWISMGYVNGDFHNGIDLTRVQNGIIENNMIAANYRGIFIDWSSKVVVRNNQFQSNHDTCITIDFSNNNTIVYNNFTYNTGYGVEILDSGSVNNKLHHNNFIRTKTNKQAYDAGHNSWDENGQGNYWDEWTSPDNNSDGIVDQPYVLDGGAGAQDNYPLTGRNPVCERCTIYIFSFPTLLFLMASVLYCRKREKIE